MLISLCFLNASVGPQYPEFLTYLHRSRTPKNQLSILYSDPVNGRIYPAESVTMLPCVQEMFHYVRTGEYDKIFPLYERRFYTANWCKTQTGRIYMFNNKMNSGDYYGALDDICDLSHYDPSSYILLSARLDCMLYLLRETQYDMHDIQEYACYAILLGRRDNQATLSAKGWGVLALLNPNPHTALEWSNISLSFIQRRLRNSNSYVLNAVQSQYMNPLPVGQTAETPQ